VLKLALVAVFDRVTSNLFIVSLQSSQVFASLGELAFLHALTNIPVNEGTLGVHQVELVGQRRPGLGNCGGVGEHTTRTGQQDGLCRAFHHLHSTIDLGEISIGHHLGWLVTDANLEAGRAPIDELDRALRLQCGHSLVDVVGDHISSVQEASRHVFAVARITLDHLVVGLEARHGNLLHRVGLMLCFGCGDDGCVGNKREVDARVGNKVGLELGKIDVEGTIETEGGGDRGHNCDMLACHTWRGTSNLP
jgi:hypothetical protein